MITRRLLLFLSVVATVSAQRFLRDGFTSKLDEEFKYEAGLDNANSPVGMPREMFVLADLDLELVPAFTPPPTTTTSQRNNMQQRWAVPNNKALTRHLNQYLKQPLKLQLEQRKGGIGYRAFGITPQGQRLRGSWRRTEAPRKLLNSDFLTVPYDEAVRSRLMFLEIELVLPRLPPKHRGVFSQKGAVPTQGKTPIPRLVYQLALEGGVMNPKAVIPRGDCAGRVIYSSDRNNNTTVGPPFAAKLGLRLKPGLVDPSWARGRTILRKGRSVGVI